LEKRGREDSRVKDTRGQGFKGLLSKNFISAFDILSISEMSLLFYPGIGGRKLGGKKLKAER